MLFQLTNCYKCKEKFDKIEDSNEWECKKCELIVYNKYENYMIHYKKCIISYDAFNNTNFSIYIPDEITFKHKTIFEHNYLFNELMQLNFSFIEDIISTAAENLVFL